VAVAFASIPLLRFVFVNLVLKSLPELFVVMVRRRRTLQQTVDRSLAVDEGRHERTIHLLLLPDLRRLGLGIVGFVARRRHHHAALLCLQLGRHRHRLVLFQGVKHAVAGARRLVAELGVDRRHHLSFGGGLQGQWVGLEHGCLLFLELVDLLLQVGHHDYVAGVWRVLGKECHLVPARRQLRVQSGKLGVLGSGKRWHQLGHV